MSIRPVVKPGKVWKCIIGFTRRRGYIRAWDTTRPTRYILDIQPAKSLLSWVI